MTVTADQLPAVQIDGVVCSQVVVGDTVYAAGKFTRARPAGAAAGTQEVVRNNLLAFDIRTGALITSCVPDLNAQALVVTASADGSRIYVGGDLTRANGQVRNHVAAYSTATGQLVSEFRPSVASAVRAIAATNTTVYLGGNFSAVGSVSRSRLAAVSASNGALLPWAPQPGHRSHHRQPAPGPDGQLEDQHRGHGVGRHRRRLPGRGRWSLLHPERRPGLRCRSARRGHGGDPALPDRRADHQSGGQLGRVQPEHGRDGGLRHRLRLLRAGEPRGRLRGRPQRRHRPLDQRLQGRQLRQLPDERSAALLDPRARLLADQRLPPSRARGSTSSPPRSACRPTASSATGRTPTSAACRRPRCSTGSPRSRRGPTPTGQNQAGWHVSGDSRYIVYGGEFTAVNGVAQQGLVRFAMPSLAPNKVIATPAPSLTATAIAPGTVRVGWRAVVDQDHEYLTYRVYRDGNENAPIGEFVRPSTWWRAPGLAFTDRGVSAGTHTYRVTASDPAGNRRGSAWVPVPVTAGGGSRPYAQTVHADGAIDQWSLGEGSGTTAWDTAGTSDATINGGVTNGVTGAISGDADPATSFSGTSTGLVATRTAVSGPLTFSVEAWFQTTSTAGGKIVGFGNANTGLSSSYDRHVYMDAAGRVGFGVYDGPGGR